MNKNKIIRPLGHLMLLGWMTIAVSSVGCAPTYTDFSAFIRSPRPLVTSTEYRLAPPDVIAITSKRVREIQGHTEQIRPDGMITLPLLGTFYVAGSTVEEVSAQLQLLASEYYEDADVSVRVIGFKSKKIFVFGEVSGAGPYQYNGANTILGTLARAQPTRLADKTKIQILRPDPNGQLRKRMTINLNMMVKKGDTSLDAVLEEGDIIFVPPNPLAAVGLAVQQLLIPITPIATVVTSPTNIDRDLGRGPYGSNQNTAAY